jgi:hypothetical protein
MSSMQRKFSPSRSTPGVVSLTPSCARCPDPGTRPRERRCIPSSHALVRAGGCCRPACASRRASQLSSSAKALWPSRFDGPTAER